MSSPEPRDAFVVTGEYRRFAEFCDACRHYRYIGLCFGAPGVGKTLSARYFAAWGELEAALLPDLYCRVVDLPVPPAHVIDCRTLFYTPAVATSPTRIRTEIERLRERMARTIDRAMHFEHRSALELWRRDSPPPVELIIVDESDRLKMTGLEQVRDIYDRRHIGVVLIGMPGIEKRLARYPQLYSRVGFVHHFRPLPALELRALLKSRWRQLGMEYDPGEPHTAEAGGSIERITGGNFRLLDRLLAQIDRILRINEMQVITKEVVEAARESLVLGPV